MIVLTSIALWAGCGLFAYGRCLAHFQRKFAAIAHRHRAGDRVTAALSGALGPCGALAVLIACDRRYGFQWW